MGVEFVEVIWWLFGLSRWLMLILLSCDGRVFDVDRLLGRMMDLVSRI